MGSHYDVVIVGAGLQGLATARIFLQLNPGLNLVILDSRETIGGVWCKEKLYHGMKTNNLRGTYEYTDFPMHDDFGVKKEEHIPGESVHEYFYQYAEKHDLTRRIHLQTKVTVAEKIQQGWKLKLENANTKGLNSGSKRVHSPSITQETITCAKLVIAAGIASVPQPINIKGSEDFQAPIVSFGDFATEAPKINEDPAIKNVTVLGGGKAACDVVYSMATHGKQVTWIIRASGNGATYTAPAHIYIGPFRCWLEKLTTTRFFTLLSPCIWGDADGFGYLRNLLHTTSLGRKIVDVFWWKLGADVIDQTHIATHPETKKLQPDQSPLWCGTTLSILNYPTDIYELVRSGQVKVIRKDVARLESPKTVRFEDESEVQSDALICCMGWRFEPSIEFRPKEIHADLGIPSADLSESQKELWDKLDALADREILTRFPLLKTGPAYKHNPLLAQRTLPNTNLADKSLPPQPLTPWRLWRGIAPPALPTHDIVFLGIVVQIQNPLRSEISSLWAYAYLHHQLHDPCTSISNSAAPLSLTGIQATDEQVAGTGEKATATAGTAAGAGSRSINAVMYDAALFNRFGRWRTPCGSGPRHPDLVFEGLPYLDLLLGDLGISGWRKGWGWVGELLGGAYGQRDYRGFVEEWRGMGMGKRG